MSFVHGNCPLSGIRRFPLERGLKCIKSMLVSISVMHWLLSVVWRYPLQPGESLLDGGSTVCNTQCTKR